ncbi:MAG: zinc ribbon domain-containing protein [Candidatus Coatesbacteria bacterium]|nr:zinc ribbon domain-containing protein [Candidatus Coatesbacteria bacterium]
MPTYEYECMDCGHHFERLQDMNDKPVEECPKCSGKVRRLLSGGAGIIFKGEGFYATDYKRHDQAKSAGRHSSCDRSSPCCGRSDPCDKKPCTD